MKLCFIGDFPLPNNSPIGGAECVLYNLAKAISETDSQITIDIIAIHDDINIAFVDERFSNVKIHYFPKLKLIPRSFGDPFIVKNFLKKHNFDLIHTHYSIMLSRAFDINTPKILTLHGIYNKEKKYGKNPLVSLIFDYNEYIFKKNISKFDGFVAISPYIIDELKEMGVFNKVKKIFRINNPIDASFFDVVPKSNDNIIFYPATIGKLKNQIAAIHAIKPISNKVKNIKLIFAGSFEKEYFNQFLEEINKKYLNGCVDYIGIVSREEILELYSKSAIVYLLSKQEVQPMTILEAMATSTPVIASNLKGISYLVKDGINGYLVNPDEPKEVEKYTLKLLCNKEKRLEMGKNAKKMAEENYSASIVAEQTLKMYKEILTLEK